MTVDKMQVALVLAKIAAVDNRRLDDPEGVETPITDAWYEALCDLSFQDCLDAVAEFRRESSEWLHPADVRERAMVKARSRNAEVSDRDLTADLDPALPGHEWVRILRERRRTISLGGSPQQAMRAITVQTVRAEVTG